MATSNLKRKADTSNNHQHPSQKAAKIPNVNGNKPSIEDKSQPRPPGKDVAVQIVTGSYDRVLHGICARIPSQLLQPPTSAKSQEHPVTFTDTFLFAAHAYSIRCLAISPATDSNKRTLATGSSDERINLFTLSTTPPPPAPSSKGPQTLLPTLSNTPTIPSENPKNRSLGSLTHHTRPITRLHFPSKSKLFTSAEDNSLSIARTRDWTLLSTIKAPIPKPHGRPSGDTAAPGELPAGINDFAVHPSQKLMLSVGRGERCMRLWNLMTGKKAGVLNFEREVLALVGEGRKSARGEGRCVLWDAAGESFVVGFERAAVVFGIDSRARAVVRPEPGTKVHRMRVLSRDGDGSSGDVLAVSTEDGRILFFDMQADVEESSEEGLPSCHCIAELGGKSAGIAGRIKDFEILQLPSASAGEQPAYLIVAGSSDGAIRLWTMLGDELSIPHSHERNGIQETGGKMNGTNKSPNQVGTLIGTLETGNRITCLGAFVMDSKHAEEMDVGSEPMSSASGVDDESESSSGDGGDM